MVETGSGEKEFNICGSYYRNRLAAYSSIWGVLSKYIGYFIIGVNFGCR